MPKLALVIHNFQQLNLLMHNLYSAKSVLIIFKSNHYIIINVDKYLKSAFNYLFQPKLLTKLSTDTKHTETKCEFIIYPQIHSAYYVLQVI